MHCIDQRGTAQWLHNVVDCNSEHIQNNGASLTCARVCVCNIVEGPQFINIVYYYVQWN